MLVCIARPELLEQRAEWSREEANASSLRLEPLPDIDCEALIGNLARGLAQETTVRVLETAEGNPLFIEQLVAMLAEEDHADQERSIPPTIDALLSARLDRLGPGERAVISRAAIVGKEFSAEATLDLLPERRPRLRHSSPGDPGEQGVHRIRCPRRARRRLSLPSHPHPAGGLPGDSEDPAG